MGFIRPADEVGVGRPLGRVGTRTVDEGDRDVVGGPGERVDDASTYRRDGPLGRRTGTRGGRGAPVGEGLSGEN